MKANRNSTAVTTWSSTSCSWRMMPLTSITVRLGKSRASSLVRPPACRRQVEGGHEGLRASAPSAAGLMMTKKLARIEPHSSLRRLVTLASTDGAADVEAQHVAQLQAQASWRCPARPRLRPRPGLSAYHLPATTSLVAGSSRVADRLNSRSARRCASSCRVGLGGDGVAVDGGQAAADHRIQQRVAHAGRAPGAAPSVGLLLGHDVDDEAVRRVRRRGAAPGRHQVAAHHGQQQQRHQAQRQRHHLHDGGARTPLQRGDGEAPALVVDGAAQARAATVSAQPADQREHARSRPESRPPSAAPA